MIRINGKEVTPKVEQGPTIIIRVGKKPLPSVAKVMKEAVIDGVKKGTQSDLLTHGWAEYNKVLLERKKLSNQISHLVEDGATKDELKNHYDRIDSLIEEGAELFDRVRHVEQYGRLPEPVAPNIDILLLKDQKKKLVDLRCKLSKKLTLAQAKNPKKIIEWQYEIDKANAEYMLVDLKIKKLEGKA